MRVLLAEDNQELRSLLAEALIDADCEVVEAESSDAAALLVDCPDGFDVLVTDIHMPGRLNGLGLGRLFQARHARTPILYMTGRPDAMCGVRLRPDREAVLFKPCRLSALVTTMRVMVAKNRRDCRENSGSCLDLLRAYEGRVSRCGSPADTRERLCRSKKLGERTEVGG